MTRLIAGVLYDTSLIMGFTSEAVGMLAEHLSEPFQPQG